MSVSTLMFNGIFSMSPLASVVKLLRKSRNLRSKDAAEMIGCEPSYVSAVEGGLKIPSLKSDYIDLLIKHYQLNEAETKLVRDAHKRSQRSYLIPIKASEDEYSLFYELFERVGKLLPHEAQMMRMVLAGQEKTTPD